LEDWSWKLGVGSWEREDWRGRKEREKGEGRKKLKKENNYNK
jgi:hypothetical protein